MDKQKLLKRIEEVEGRRYKMYLLDGIPHIGIGHNIVGRELAEETLEFLGIEDEKDLLKAELNDEQCESLFFKDLDIAIVDAVSVIGEAVFESLSSDRQDVLIDMSFNLGKARFGRFKKMIAALQSGDYAEAAAQILDSNAARDPLTKSRYENLAKEMRGENLFTEGSELIKPSEISKFSDVELITELHKRFVKPHE